MPQITGGGQQQRSQEKNIGVRFCKQYFVSLKGIGLIHAFEDDGHKKTRKREGLDLDIE